MQALYISRHDEAVRKIHQALCKCPTGTAYTIMLDACREADLPTLGAEGKRIPEWLLPHIPIDTRKKWRPDILRLVPRNDKARQVTDPAQATAHKEQYTLQLIEVGYTSDLRWRETFSNKRLQHEELKTALQDAGWHVEQFTLVFGSTGVIYADDQADLKKLGLTAAATSTLLKKINGHTVQCLWDIICGRRQHEREAIGVG